ncbi:MAG: sugar phosphate isomerase/epimerase family protein [Bacteroidota bacterium]
MHPAVKRRSFLKWFSASAMTLPFTAYGISRASYKYFDQDIYLFSKHLQWLDCKNAARTAKEIGFDGLDLTVRPKGHVLPENVERDLPKAINAIRKAGMKVEVITTAITGAEEQYTEAILKIASQLEIKSYRLGWLKYDAETSIDKQLENYRKRLATLAKMNEHYQIRGDYQNHAGTSVGSAVWDIWYLLKDIDPKWMGCRYDIRHAVAEGFKSGKVNLRLLKEHIQSLDIKDYTYVQENGQWTIQHTPLGKGAVDFEDYFKTLKELNISKPLTLHTEYELGGANKGKYELSIPAEQVISALTTDLNYLQKAMNKH